MNAWAGKLVDPLIRKLQGAGAPSFECGLEEWALNLGGAMLSVVG